MLLPTRSAAARRPLWLLLALAGALAGWAPPRAAPPHPIHVSLTEVNYNGPELTLEISHRIFRDDLELALRAFCQCPIAVQADRPSAQLDSLAARYLARHSIWRADLAPLAPRYLGHEFDGEALWLHLEAASVRPFARLSLQQDLLCEVYDDQSAIVNFTCAGQLRSARLTRGQPSAELPCGR